MLHLFQRRGMSSSTKAVGRQRKSRKYFISAERTRSKGGREGTSGHEAPLLTCANRDAQSGANLALMLIDASSLEEHRRAGFELISRVPLAFVWRQFASKHECDALVAHGEAARDFAARQVAPSGAGAQDEAQISYGIEGFRRVVEIGRPWRRLSE